MTASSQIICEYTIIGNLASISGRTLHGGGTTMWPPRRSFTMKYTNPKKGVIEVWGNVNGWALAHEIDHQIGLFDPKTRTSLSAD